MNLSKITYALFIMLVTFCGYITFLITVEVSEIYKDRKENNLSYLNLPNKGKVIADNIYDRAISSIGLDTLRTEPIVIEDNTSKIPESNTTTVVSAITDKQFDKNTTKKDIN